MLPPETQVWDIHRVQLPHWHQTRYRMGQGAGDACNWWVIGSDSLASTNSKAANRWTMHPPNNTDNLIQSLTAFINDVNLFVSQNSNISDHKFLTLAQQDIHRWQGILQSTGRELNTKKCFWSDFNPQFDQNGTPSISGLNPNQTPFYLTNPDGTPDIMCNTTSNKGIQHLRVHISMDGNQKIEERCFWNDAEYSK